MLEIFHKIRRRGTSIAISPFINKDSKTSFFKNVESAREEYKDVITDLEYSEFLMPAWEENTKVITDYFNKGFSFDFLRHPTLRGTMFAHLPWHNTEIQKDLLRKEFSLNHLKQILKEHNAGKPILNDWEFKTSGNSIHQLYHLAKFQRRSGVPVTNCEHILEYGGGYGNMAKIAKKINPDITYTIIDIPIFSFIQLVYLRTIFGHDQVTLHDGSEGITKGKINIVPLQKTGVVKLNDSLTESPDIFVSTWALSESNLASQQLVSELNFFNAKQVLIAYQKTNELFAHAESIAKGLTHYDIYYNEEIGHQLENFYLFAKRNSA